LPLPLTAATLLAATLLSPLRASSQILSPIDCSYAVTASGLQDCLRLQNMALQSNRNYCLNRINNARRLEAAGVRNAWQQVPTECLY
jgi:hypothetical protein